MSKHKGRRETGFGRRLRRWWSTLPEVERGLALFGLVAVVAALLCLALAAWFRR